MKTIIKKMLLIGFALAATSTISYASEVINLRGICYSHNRMDYSHAAALGQCRHDLRILQERSKDNKIRFTGECTAKSYRTDPDSSCKGYFYKLSVRAILL